MTTFTLTDIAKFKSYCLKAKDRRFLKKVLKMEDYCLFNGIDGIRLDLNYKGAKR